MIYRSFKSIIPFLTKIVFSIYWLLYANLRVLLCTNFTSTISIQESKFLVQTIFSCLNHTNFLRSSFHSPKLKQNTLWLSRIMYCI